MKRHWRVLLIVIAVVCFGVALSYPIRYRMAQESNNSNMESLSALRQQVREQEGDAPAEAPPQAAATEAPEEPNAAAPTEQSAPAADPQEVPEAPAENPVDSATAHPEPTEAPTEPQGEAPADVPANDAAAQPEPTEAPTDLQGEAPADAPSNDAAAQPEPTEAPTEPQGEAPADVPVNDAAAQPEPTEATVEPQGEPPAEVPANDAAAQQPEPTEATVEPQGEPPAEAATPEPAQPTPEPTPTPVPTPTPTLGIMDLLLELPETPSPDLPEAAQEPAEGLPTIEPTPTPDRTIRYGALPYPEKEKILLDEAKILPDMAEIRALNPDFIGWLTIPGTIIDYPVVQAQNGDSAFYLDHDFYGNDNINGQIILDSNCDPYTPSYNLILSGHHMKNGSMFGNLPEYRTKSYWKSHQFVEFDTLMERKQYVVFAAFYSADYDEDEEGFRYNADVRYRKEVDMWLAEIRENQLYDTEIDVEFGDEFITLTTCNRARHRNGRFVVVCRKVREGETFE